jgi:hypothetical protein
VILRGLVGGDDDGSFSYTGPFNLVRVKLSEEVAASIVRLVRGP